MMSYDRCRWIAVTMARFAIASLSMATAATAASPRCSNQGNPLGPVRLIIATVLALNLAAVGCAIASNHPSNGAGVVAQAAALGEPVPAGEKLYHKPIVFDSASGTLHYTRTTPERSAEQQVGVCAGCHGTSGADGPLPTRAQQTGDRAKILEDDSLFTKDFGDKLMRLASGDDLPADVRSQLRVVGQPVPAAEQPLMAAIETKYGRPDSTFDGPKAAACRSDLSGEAMRLHYYGKRTPTAG